jgi:hypothetical protein
VPVAQLHRDQARVFEAEDAVKAAAAEHLDPGVEGHAREERVG